MHEQTLSKTLVRELKVSFSFNHVGLLTVACEVLKTSSPSRGRCRPIERSLATTEVVTLDKGNTVASLARNPSHSV